MRKEDSIWVNLYNCLYILSSNFCEIEYLNSPIFEVFDELETALYMGLKEDSLNQFLSEKWIDLELKEELNNLRNFVDNIEPKLWNSDKFDSHEDWKLVKKWSSNLLSRLSMKKKGWNNTGEIIIYSEEKTNKPS